MFEWLYNLFFGPSEPVSAGIKLNFDVYPSDRTGGYTYEQATANDVAGNGKRLPTLDEAQAAIKTGEFGPVTETWCKSDFDKFYAWVVWSDGSRKKCSKTEYHPVFYVKSKGD